MKNKQGNKGFMTLKIDFEKAYDRLRWDFIRDTLVQMNLPIHLIHMIMHGMCDFGIYESALEWGANGGISSYKGC